MIISKIETIMVSSAVVVVENKEYNNVDKFE